MTPASTAPDSRRRKKYAQIALPEVTKVAEEHTKSMPHFFRTLLAPIAQLGIEKERRAFLQNLTVLLRAGISLTEALETIHLELKYRRMKKLTGIVLSEINAGVPLWKTLEAHDVLSTYQISIIRIGEESGFLAKNVEYLGIQQEKDRQLRRKVQSALFYPSVVLFLSIVIMIVIIVFVLPQLVVVFHSLDAPLPPITRFIIATSLIGSQHGGLIFLLFMGILGMLYVLYHITPIRYGVHIVMLRVPIISQILQNSAVARMGIILGTLLKVGIPPVRAIEHVADSISLLPYRRYFRQLSTQIDIGKSFKNTMEMTPGTAALIPRPAQQLIVSGEKSGQIADMFMKISEIYALKTEEITQVLPTILEPVLLIFISSCVGVIAYAILIPIYSILSAV